MTSINLSNIRTQEQANQIASDLKSGARTEILKAGANMAMAGGVLIAASSAAYLACKVAAFIIAIATFPLAVIAPLWSLTANIGGLGVGVGAGYLFFQKYGMHFYKQGNEHYAHAQHLYSEGKKVNQLTF